VLAGASVVTLLVLEAALRVLPLRDPTMVAAFHNPHWERWADPAWGNPSPRAYRAEPTLGYEHAPGVVEHVALAAHPAGGFEFRTDALGLRRDGEVGAAGPVRRVLVLGDSHTDGYVDNRDSFSTLLEHALRRDAGDDAIEVLNAGVVGYSPAQAALWYGVHGVALRPEVVVLVLYAGNDVAELDDPSKPGLDPATGRAVPPTEGGAAGPGRFGPHDRFDAIRLVVWLRAAVRYGPLAPLWRRLGLPGRATADAELRADTLAEVLRRCHGCFWQSLQQAQHAARHPAAMAANVGRVAAIAARLDADVRAQGGRLVVALLPTRAQVEPAAADAERAPVARLLELGPAALAFEDEVLAELAVRVAAAAIPVVPLRDALRDAAATEAQYYPRDWHLGPAGHRTVAAALASALASTRRFVPDQASR
jgi:lysophospholipase L1-like esterase